MAGHTCRIVDTRTGQEDAASLRNYVAGHEWASLTARKTSMTDLPLHLAFTLALKSKKYGFTCIAD